MTFLLALAFANLLPKEVYGQYKYILGVTGLLGALTLTGLETSVIQAVSRGYEGVLKTAFRKNIAWSFLLTTSAIGAAIYYMYFEENSVLAYSLWIAAFLVPFTRSAQLYSSYLNGKKLFRIKIGYETASTIVAGIALVAAVYFSGRVFVIISAYFISYFILSLFFYYRTMRVYAPNNMTDPEFMGYAKHLSFLNVLDIIASNIDKVLVFNFVGPAALAIYSFAIGIPEQTKPFLKGITNIILPRFSERSEGDIRRNLGNKIVKMLLFNAVITTSYISFSPLLYGLFFPQYHESVFYSQIFAVSLLAGSITPIEIFLLAKKKIKEQYVVRMSVSLFQIVSVFVFTFWLGLAGLILARVATRFFVAAANLFIYFRMPAEEIG